MNRTALSTAAKAFFGQLFEYLSDCIFDRMIGKLFGGYVMECDMKPQPRNQRAVEAIGLAHTAFEQIAIHRAAK